MPNETNPMPDASSTGRSGKPAGLPPSGPVSIPGGERAEEPAPEAGATEVARDESGPPRLRSPSAEPAEPNAPPDTAARKPLITAIEIENFKGIGAPIRIDLRPITLLFGQNSAGKSTVLHALCYAHEILSHRDVDAYATHHGGQQIDLGGFRSLVHRHDPTRTVRIRFEMNLEGWNGYTPLHELVLPEYYDLQLASTLDDVVARATSGWVELRAALRDEQPALVGYEVGVNGILFGRLDAGPVDVDLTFNPGHPMLAVQRRAHLAPDSPSRSTPPNSAKEGAQPGTVSPAESGTVPPRLPRVRVWGLESPLPGKNEFLHLDVDEMQEAGYDYDVDTRVDFEARVTTLLAGIGHTLRDELARFRYIGPIGVLHPDPGDESRGPDPMDWADGTAAWTRLRNSSDPQMITAVSDWLERADRLDTGYALHSRSLVTIHEEDAALVSALRTYHQLRKEFGRADGSVDLDRWVHTRREALSTS